MPASRELWSPRAFVPFLFDLHGGKTGGER
jgi:hypothetical protein